MMWTVWGRKMLPSESRIRHYMWLQRFVTSILNIENIYVRFQLSGQIGQIWALLKISGILKKYFNTFEGVFSWFYGQNKYIKVKKLSIFPSKHYTFWGQKRLNIWNSFYMRKKNVHVSTTWYKSLYDYISGCYLALLTSLITQSSKKVTMVDVVFCFVWNLHSTLIKICSSRRTCKCMNYLFCSTLNSTQQCFPCIFFFFASR